MSALSAYQHPDQWSSFDQSGGIPAVSTAEWSRLSPDRHWILHQENRILARCSAWVDALPEWEGNVPGAIGHFEAVDAQRGREVLIAAMEWLKASGRDFVVGPINGNTWNSYRLVTKSDGRPPFVMEPAHPSFYTDLWRAEGFESVADYLSAEVPLKLQEDPRLERTIQRLQKTGVKIRSLNRNDYDDELRRIYSVSRRAFAGNFFYTDIQEDDFLFLYRPYRDRLDPRLVFLAEKNGEVVGFLFGVPDLLQATRGEIVDTVVYKTVATLPQRELAGLGLWLSHLGHEVAEELGYRRVIHALITSQSRLGDLSWDDVTVFREYSLFGRKI